MKIFLLIVDIPSVPRHGRRGADCKTVRSRIHRAVERPADYCQSRLVTGIQNHIGMQQQEEEQLAGAQQVRGGASGGRILVNTQ